MKALRCGSRLFLACALILGTLTPAARALDFWESASDGNWSTPSSWHPTGEPPMPRVPPPDGDAIFGSNLFGDPGSIGTYTVTVNGNTIKNVSIGTAKITFSLAGSFTVTDTMGLGGGGADVTIAGTGTMSSGKIGLNGGKFTISQAGVTTGDFMTNFGGPLLVQNGGSLTSGANTVTTAGFTATVDGSNSKWTNTGLLNPEVLTITNGGMVKSDTVRILGLTMTGGTLQSDLLENFGVSQIMQGSSITSTTAMLTGIGSDSTLDGSTWTVSGKLTGFNSSLVVKNGGQLTTGSVLTDFSAGIVVDGSSATWNNTGDATITSSGGPNAGLRAVRGGAATIGGNLFLQHIGSLFLNIDDTGGASRVDVTGKFDASGGSGVFVGQNATVKSAGAVTRASDDSGQGFIIGVDLEVRGTWTNTGDFVVGESGQNSASSLNTLRVSGGTVKTTGDLIVGKLAAQNSFNVSSDSTVMDVNGVLAQGAGSLTNAFVGNFGGADAKWTNSGTLTVADAGQANLTVDTGGIITNIAATVGNQAGSKGSVTVRGGGELKVNGDLTIGAAGMSTGSVAALFGGKLTVTGTTVTLGRDVGSVGKLSLYNDGGKGTQFNFGGDLQVGLAGMGTLEILSGFQLDQGAKSLVLGGQATADGTLHVSDDLSIYKSTNLTIGSLGTGTLNIEKKGFVQTTGDAVLGKKNGGTGMATVTDAGSKWEVDGKLVIGQMGLGNGDGGTVTIKKSGVLDVKGAQVTIGQEMGSVGLLTIDGFASKLTGSGSTNVEIARHGTGTLQLLNGAQFSVASLTLGALDGGKGNVKVDGMENGTASTFETRGSLTVGGVAGASGEIDITGGGQVIARNNAVIGRDSGSTGVVMLSGKGSTWNIMAGGTGGTGNLIVGKAGIGTFNISDGAQFTGGVVTVGEIGGGGILSQVVLTGTGAAAGAPNTAFTATGKLTISGSGLAEFNASAGAKIVTQADVIVTDQNAGGGRVELDTKASWQANGANFIVGKNGTGTLRINGGASVKANRMAIGEDTGGSGAVHVVGQGSLLETADVIAVGTIASTDALLDVASGGRVMSDVSGVTMRGSASRIFLIGPGSMLSASVLTVEAKSVNISVTNGTFKVAAGDIELAGSATNAQLKIGTSGQFLAAASTLRIGPAVSATVNVDGGTLVTGDARLDGLNTEVDIGAAGAPTSTWKLSNAEGQEGKLTLLNTANLRVQDGGQVTADGTVFVENGILQVDGNGASLTAHGVRVDDGIFQIFNGQVTSLGEGPLSSVVQIAGGRLDLSGANSRLEASHLTISGSGVMSATASSYVTLDLDATISAGANLDVTGGGRMDIGITSNQAPAGTIQVGLGGILKDNGAVTGNVVVQLGGTVGGAGTINGKLINGGKAGPGDPQTLTVNGDYQQLNDGLLQIAIAGTNPMDFDHLAVTGHITLDTLAMLQLDFISGFAPKTGNIFDFIESDADTVFTGAFTPTNIQITGLADGFLYTVGQTSPNHFGLVALNDGISVPEPGSVLLLAIGFAVVAARRRR